VVLRQINKTLTATPDGPNNIYNLDVNGDGTTDFTFTTIIGIPSDPTFASFAVVNAPFGTQNGAVIDAFTGDGFPTVSRLKTGDIVSSSNLFFDASFDQGNLFFIATPDAATGNFQNKSGFIGLRFQSGTDTLYGFAQIKVNDLFAANDPLALTIGTVGYESVAGNSVRVTAVPEPSAAAIIMTGFAFIGLTALRNRKRNRRTV